MKKTEFKKIVADGIARDKQFLVVKIETEGNPAPEIIVNPYDNINAKIAYYDKAYSDNMELIGRKGTPGDGKRIHITDALMTSNLNDLSWFIY